MPRQETILQVFVASPGDLADERAALEDVIRELNSTWSRTLGYRLDLVRWETHAVPGIGHDAQDVVNKTVPQDCDIFVGMLWSRFGTPTSRADAGTEEEFDTALRRYRYDANSVRIMFYFKDEPLPPSAMDPEELRRIRDFRTRLGEAGSLYWKFNTVDEFQNLIRVHLSRVVQDWGQSPAATSSSPSPSEQPRAVGLATTAGDPDQDAEEGLLDLVDEANEAFAKLSELAARMTAAIEEIGQKIAQRTREIEDLHPERGSYDVKAAKRIAARAAADLTEYATRTEVDVPIFADTLATAMSALGRAASISEEFARKDTDDVQALLQNAQSLRRSLIGSGEQLQGFRDSIAAMPRVTGDLNKAKRTALATMTALLREFDIGASHVSELEQSLQQIIQRFRE